MPTVPEAPLPRSPPQSRNRLLRRQGRLLTDPMVLATLSGPQKPNNTSSQLHHLQRRTCEPHRSPAIKYHLFRIQMRIWHRRYLQGNQGLLATPWHRRRHQKTKGCHQIFHRWRRRLRGKGLRCRRMVRHQWRPCHRLQARRSCLLTCVKATPLPPPGQRSVVRVAMEGSSRRQRSHS